MKASTIVTILLVVGAVYYWTDGGTTLGLNAPKNLPETIAPPNATFMGDEQANPFFAH